MSLGKDIVFTATLVKNGATLKSGMFAFNLRDEFVDRLKSLVINGAKACPVSVGQVWHEATLVYECNDQGVSTGGTWE